MKLYVASSWRNVLYEEIVEALRDAGHEVLDWRAQDTAFRWSDVGGVQHDDDENPQGLVLGAGFVDLLSHPKARAALLRDVSMMLEADACVLLTPCGNDAHMEAGWFVGSGKRVVVFLPPFVAQKPSLMWGLGGLVTTSVGGLVELLANREL